MYLEYFPEDALEDFRQWCEERVECRVALQLRRLLAELVEEDIAVILKQQK